MIKNKIILLYICVRNFLSTKTKIFYIVENAEWSIKHDGLSITSCIKHAKITITHRWIRNSIIHFGSVNLFLRNKGIPKVHKSNRTIVTWFHVSGNENLSLLPEAIDCVDIWHTSCNLTRDKMIELGIPKHKIEVIPLGVNLEKFKQANPQLKIQLKKNLNIPENKVIIGYFQKDGLGWGNGEKPKLIKGPDIFCDVIEKLSKRYEVFVLLTGPARGYVKNRLKDIHVPFCHKYLKTPDELAEYYSVLDLYIITSREEGGPKAILESWAAGVPLISTKVGMAIDIIKEGENGFLCNIEDVEGIYKKACNVLDDINLSNSIIINAINNVRSYHWSDIANEYLAKLYTGII